MLVMNNKHKMRESIVIFKLINALFCSVFGMPSIMLFLEIKEDYLLPGSAQLPRVETIQSCLLGMSLEKLRELAGRSKLLLESYAPLYSPKLRS